jgi:hypothetical protein
VAPTGVLAGILKPPVVASIGKTCKGVVRVHFEAALTNATIPALITSARSGQAARSSDSGNQRTRPSEWRPVRCRWFP